MTFELIAGQVIATVIGTLIVAGLLGLFRVVTARKLPAGLFRWVARLIDRHQSLITGVLVAVIGTVNLGLLLIDVPLNITYVFFLVLSN